MQNTTQPRAHRLVIAILMVSTFVVILNETILSVALNHLMHDLDVDAVTVQWLATAFMLTMAVIIPITGFLLQRFPTRQVFMLAMSLFSLGTLVCAIAPSFSPLLFGRIVQASGTAVMMPLLMTTVMDLVPADHRGRVMGNISVVISVAPAIGPTMSGLILRFLPWRFLFLAVLPIAIAMLIVGLRRIENVSQTRHQRIDVVSIVLSALGFGGLVFGLTSLGGGHETSGSAETVSGAGSGLASAAIPAAVGAVAFVLFIIRQLQLQKHDRALLDLRTFTRHTFSFATATLMLAMAALFGIVILLPIYLQSSLGLDTLQVGLMLLPGGLLMGLLAPSVGRLYDRIGARPLLIPGCGLVMAVLWGFSMISATTPWWGILVGHLVLSFGLGLTFTPLFSTALGSLPPHLYSHGSATVGTAQQVAAAAGTALFVTVMSTRSAALIADGAAAAQAVAHGAATAFTFGAVLMTGALVCTLWVRKTEAQAEVADDADTGEDVLSRSEGLP
ncbi:DHA2 family efflux MFS transporter permease subunit [Devriesea agamarum]|uniref:DHA2 family efflux MFS transporter permease subunit n=1 Tax=Devriesea agamarum TaxID=472569 RepID=UPI000A05278F|nr:DHA2 family efflux MFS transporter permease subunit [Devriesea agamarum]